MPYPICLAFYPCSIFYLCSCSCSVKNNHEDYTEHSGCLLWQHGPRQTLLDHQAEQGWPHVDEDCLEALILDKNETVPAVADLSGDKRTELILKATQMVKPNWTLELALKSMHKGYVTENPDIKANVRLPEEVLYDALPKAEVHQVRSYIGQVREAQKKQQAYIRQRHARASRYFKQNTRATRKKTIPKPPSPNAELPEATSWILKHAPVDKDGDGTIIISDPYNGRYRIVSPGSFEWKSVSWTRRGYQQCAKLVVYYAWQFEEQYYGVQPPFRLKDLLDENCEMDYS